MKKEVEKLKKENEELKKRGEKGKSENEEMKITSLSSLKVEFADERRMKREGYSIVHHGFSDWSSCLIGDEMKTVYLSFYCPFLHISLLFRESIDCFSFLLVLL